MARALAEVSPATKTNLHIASRLARNLAALSTAVDVTEQFPDSVELFALLIDFGN